MTKLLASRLPAPLPAYNGLMLLTSPIPPLPGYRPEVHGHRGCRGLRPENTLPAFLHALELGVDVLELDVIISRDRQVVVAHEPWLSARLGTGPNGEPISPQQERAYNLYQMPYATIRQCVVGELPQASFPKQVPVTTYRPLLRDVLQAVESACRLAGRPSVGYAVEVKSVPTGDDIFHPTPRPFVELVLAELQAAGVAARTTLLSFDLRILQAARAQATHQALCLLNENLIPAAILFEELGFVPDTYGPDFELLSTESVQALHAAYPGLRLVPWTLNIPADFALALQWGVTGITTDYPDQLLALLSNVV
jgi:glycerophosphoryl diester phosphodiesterase